MLLTDLSPPLPVAVHAVFRVSQMAVTDFRGHWGPVNPTQHLKAERQQTSVHTARRKDRSRVNIHNNINGISTISFLMCAPTNCLTVRRTTIVSI